MTRHLDLSPLTAALERAARSHAEARRCEAQRDLSRLELAMLLRRFGLEQRVLSDVVATDDAASLPEAESVSLRARVRGELGLLARLARRRDPRYDINRHMAVMRLAQWLGGGRPWHARETSPGVRPFQKSTFPARGHTRITQPADAVIPMPGLFLIYDERLR